MKVSMLAMSECLLVESCACSSSRDAIETSVGDSECMTIEGSGSDPHGRPLVPGGTTVVAAQGASEGTSERPPLLGFTKFIPPEHIALGTVNDDLLQSQLAHTSGPAADYFF
ncbi:hypothetical protein BJV77DRAFT_349107 [Russula vinacea]|nr:hypothetical protein BJV77DRAFT_349107 [Russula vinacea]